MNSELELKMENAIKQWHKCARMKQTVGCVVYVWMKQNNRLCVCVRMLCDLRCICAPRNPTITYKQHQNVDATKARSRAYYSTDATGPLASTCRSLVEGMPAFSDFFVSHVCVHRSSCAILIFFFSIVSRCWSANATARSSHTKIAVVKPLNGVSYFLAKKWP